MMKLWSANSDLIKILLGNIKLNKITKKFSELEGLPIKISRNILF